jgi:hypothetical protein
MRIKKGLTFMLMFAFVMVLFACDGTQTPTVTDQEKVDLVVEEFELSFDPTQVDADVILPTSIDGVTISWASNKPEVLSGSGELGERSTSNQTITLTATFTLNDVVVKKTFTVVVLAEEVIIEPTSDYEVLNPGFELGNLAGWTPTGEAFKDAYVLDLADYWAGSYNKDGEYLFTSNDHESETGTLTSSTFELGGIGFITFKLGAAKNSRQLYVSVIDTADNSEVARFGNLKFDDATYTANLVQYKADLSAHIGKDLKIQIVDNATSDWAWIAMDSFFTYYETESALPVDAFIGEDIKPVDEDCNDYVPENKYSIVNGGFDLNQLCGWTSEGTAFTNDMLTSAPISWGGQTSAPEGKYMLSNWNTESGVGTLTSGTFELGGLGILTFRLGGAKNADKVFVSVFKAEGTEVARFGNKAVDLNNIPLLITYKADLSAYIGEQLYIVVSDQATSDWGWIVIDSFETHYEDEANIPTAVEAIDLLNYVPADATVENFSFETGDFTGWIATGDAFTHITDQAQEWAGETYLFDGTYYFNTYKQGDLGGTHVGEAGMGTLTSSIFKLQGIGKMTFILGGAKHADTQYVSVYLEDGTEVARYANHLFADNPKTYLFVADLTAYLNESLYIQVVDNQASDWGIMLFDAFNTYYDKVSDLPLDAVEAENLLESNIPDLALIENFSFETGDFTGWTATGDAFTALTDQVQEWWGSYFNPQGLYYFNSWKQGDLGGTHVGEPGTGTLKSSTFTLQGSGYMTFMIGGAKDNTLIYVSVHLADGTEVSRFGNHLFADSPELHTYKADLTAYLNQELYIVITDNATTDWGIILMDAFNTYYESEADIDAEAVLANNLLDVAEPTPNTIENFSFETGDFTGWTATGDAFTAITDVAQEWGGEYYIYDGTYYFNTYKQGDLGGTHVGEAGTGTLTSSVFNLQGTGKISFILGGAKNQETMYVSVYKADGTEVSRFANHLFADNPKTYLYVADLSAYLNEDLYIQIVDQQTSDWGIILFDQFVTYYETEAAIPAGEVAVDLLAEVIVEVPANAIVLNHSFETGDFTGWTATGDAFTAITDQVQEWYGTTYTIDGSYYFNTWKQGDLGGTHVGEAGIGTLTSSTFTLQGSGHISFYLGGAKVQTTMYVSIYKADGTEVARYANSLFSDSPAINLFTADLSAFIGQDLYIQVVDNQTEDWGIFLFDAFNTYYETTDHLPQGAVVATNIL